MNNQRLIIWFFSLVLILLLSAACGAGTDDFYGYYTRVKYEIPISKAPGERAEEEEEEDEEDEEEDEEWAPRDSVITGHLSDIVVNVGGSGQFVFSREKSYLPYWQTAEGKWFVDEVIEREIDEMCLYSYVRIIEQDEEKVIVHWRYVPNLGNAGFTGVVHEIFTVLSDGTVNRKIRKPTQRVDEWKGTSEILKLKEDGIENLSGQRASVLNAPRMEVKSSPVKTDVVGLPAAWWKFDEGPKADNITTIENINGVDCFIGGSKVLWKEGVSGTSLAFDGYYSRVSFPRKKAPALRGAITVEAWVALGAYPWDVADVVHQSAINKYSNDGYSLAIDDKGHPLFIVKVGNKRRIVKGENIIELYHWSHIAGTYNIADGLVRVYLDGKLAGELSVEKENILTADTDILIGLNNIPKTQTHHVSEKIGDVRTDDGNQPRVWGLNILTKF
ncbi:MAG: LamG-like jellyroll fold domain-containing protein [Planctomycetota bacterium]|jgi:hypothetical protein